MASTVDYKSAGVDIAAGNDAVNRIKEKVESTFSPAVLTGIGSFGSLYDLKQIMTDYKHPVLVQSIDGVGTKIIVARMMQKFSSIGIDVVSATTNDIVVLGAKPLTLLDYIANQRLQPEIIDQIVSGMVKACRENGISLVGGETAEMPGTYLPGEHDVVGVITGVVEKDRVIDGAKIQPGDVVLGLAASGLHTNGFSLARKIFFELGKHTVESMLPELKQCLGEVLLEPHLNYTRPVHALLDANIPIKGMAHITGGGLLENVPRVLPKHCSVEIRKGSWPVLPVFKVMHDISPMPDSEMYRTFNMGIGLVIIGEDSITDKVRSIMQQHPAFKLYEIGQVVAGDRKVKLI